MPSYYLPNRDRQCTYKRNIETRSPNHYCRRKAINITYSEYVSVALGIHPAWEVLATSYIVICGLSECSVFFHDISYKARFSGERFVEYKKCFDFFCNFGLKHLSFLEELSEIIS
jgi:hypothetical protein